MASLQLNPMSATPIPNLNNNQIPNNWFQSGQLNSGVLPVPPQGLINPFMTNPPPMIHAGVPVANNFSGVGLNSGAMFSQPDPGSQWGFNTNASLSQQSGVTASTNLWQ